MNYSYPVPMLQGLVDTELGEMSLWFSKDTPGLDCFVQGGTNLDAGSRQELVLPAAETSTSWSTAFDLPPDSRNGFYRLRTTPSAATSPPWPPQ